MCAAIDVISSPAADVIEFRHKTSNNIDKSEYSIRAIADIKKSQQTPFGVPLCCLRATRRTNAFRPNIVVAVAPMSSYRPNSRISRATRTASSGENSQTVRTEQEQEHRTPRSRKPNLSAERRHEQRTRKRGRQRRRRRRCTTGVRNRATTELTLVLLVDDDDDRSNASRKLYR